MRHCTIEVCWHTAGRGLTLLLQGCAEAPLLVSFLPHCRTSCITLAPARRPAQVGPRSSHGQATPAALAPTTDRLSCQCQPQSVLLLKLLVEGSSACHAHNCTPCLLAGVGVTIYSLDSGVRGSHQEFRSWQDPSKSRVSFGERPGGAHVTLWACAPPTWIPACASLTGWG